MPKQKAGPRWLDHARAYLGLREIPGRAHNPKIINWWRKIRMGFSDDETPWCAGFVGGVLEECGIRSSRSAAARSYVKFGKKLSKPAYGCIVVFWRGKRTGWSGHVGFVVGVDSRGNLMVLGGNQGNAVTIKPFSRARVLAYRWPGIAPFEERYKLPLLKSNGETSKNEA